MKSTVHYVHNGLHPIPITLYTAVESSPLLPAGSQIVSSTSVAHDLFLVPHSHGQWPLRRNILDRMQDIIASNMPDKAQKHCIIHVVLPNREQPEPVFTLAQLLCLLLWWWPLLRSRTRQPLLS